MRVLITTVDAARETQIPSRVINCWFDAKRIPGIQDPQTFTRWVDIADVTAFAARHRSRRLEIPLTLTVSPVTGETGQTQDRVAEIERNDG
jgi:hypothetical protein